MELFKNLENHLTVQLLFMFIFTSIFTPIEATCPTEIDSVIQAPNKEIFLFKDDDIWRILNGKTNGPKKIHEVFPDGPNSVAAAVTENGLSVLIEEKTLYGYNQDEGTGAFTSAQGFPKSLHNRVLFYPSAAFPLTNGSIILVSGNVFATYSLNENAPSLLHDKVSTFPNLPEGLISGFFENTGDDGLYRMFSKNNVYEYNMQLQQIVHEQPLSSYLSC